LNRFDSAVNVHRNIGIMKRPSCLAAALACVAAAAFAQTPSSRDIYMYQGADRDARLVAGAKKEGQVLLYSTMTVADGKALATAFEQKYGVRVNHWRGSAAFVPVNEPAELELRVSTTGLLIRPAAASKTVEKWLN